MTWVWEGEEERQRPKKAEDIRTGAPEYQGGRTYPVDPAAAARLKRLMEEQRRQREAKAAAGQAARPKRDIIGDLQRRAKEISEMRKKEFTPEQLATAYQRFLEEKSLEKVAPEFGTSATTLSVNLQQAGYEVNLRRRDLTPAQLKELYRRYVKGEKTLALAVEVDATESTLGRHFRRAGYSFPLSKAERQALAEQWVEEQSGEKMRPLADALVPEVPAAALTAGEEDAPATAAEAGSIGGAERRVILDTTPVDFPLGGGPHPAYLVSKRNGNGGAWTPLAVAASYVVDEEDAEGERRPPDVNAFIELLIQFREELLAAGYGLRGTLVIGGPIAMTLEL